MGISQPLRLVVHPLVHAEELRRFEANVVPGPGAEDCAIWCSAIGADGYGRFWVNRDGSRVMLRPTVMRWRPRWTVRRWSRGCGHCAGVTTRRACG